jgi:DNA mismatch repair protein MutH
MEYPYDVNSKDSILEYGRLLLGKSLRDLHPQAIEYSTGKGRMGQSVEKYHFEYTPNSESEPDFVEAGIELKCTPLKENADGSMVSKERLVLNIIDYVSEAQSSFENSSFWHKNKLILLMFYLHETGVDVVDLIFKIVRLWDFPEIDKKIIRDDWNKLHEKMINGHAHEISEGDTLYLGACTKGSKAGAEMRQQFIKDAPHAQQRAYSFKSKYLNTIILDSLLHSEMYKDVFISDKQRKKIQDEANKMSSLVKSLDEFKEEETFEQLVERKFAPYYGKNIYEIESLTGSPIPNKAKSISNNVVHAILGVKTPKIREFENANLQQKTIRLEPNGTLKESMSFSQINYKGIVCEQEWEDSVWYETITQRFLFIVFRKSADGDDKKAVFEKIFFWTMPRKDIEIAQEFWKDIKTKIQEDDYSNFWKLADHKIFHVRPKARDSSDKVETPSGRLEKKKAYWLNADYILSIVEANCRPT